MTGLALVACKLAVIGGVVIATCFSVTWFHNVELISKPKGGKHNVRNITNNPPERV